jgi:hypothetical protein
LREQERARHHIKPVTQRLIRSKRAGVNQRRPGFGHGGLAPSAAGAVLDIVMDSAWMAALAGLAPAKRGLVWRGASH